MKNLVILLAVSLLAAMAVSCAGHTFESPPETVIEPPTEIPIPSPVKPEPPPDVSEPTPEPVSIIRQIPESDEVITRRYTWSFSGKKWEAELLMPEALYNYYRDLPRPRTDNYSIYITHPLDDHYIKSLTDEIEQIAQRERFSSLNKVEFVIAFVQHLPYTVDSVTTPYDEYPRYPIETLVDNGGDCEDTSILLASLLDSTGYEVTLVIFPETPDTLGHVGIGILATDDMKGAYFEVEGKRYFYIETTDTRWGIGEIPDEYRGVTARIYTMEPIPVLTHYWEASVKKRLIDSQIIEYEITLDIRVENLGSALADDVHILAGFDAGEGKIWNPVESLAFDLSVDQSATITITLQAPLGKHTRLIIQIVDNDQAVDQSHSEWFDT